LACSARDWVLRNRIVRHAGALDHVREVVVFERVGWVACYGTVFPRSLFMRMHLESEINCVFF
jgi:hypothetical protein